MKINFGKLPGKSVWLVCTALAILLSSCLDDSSSEQDPTPIAYVSIFNASPDSPGLDVLVDNRQINNQPLPFTAYTGYLNFFTGARNLKFNSFNASNALVDTTYNFEANKVYSVFVVDESASSDVLIVEDSISTPIADKAMIRFVNLVPDSQPVDIAVAEETPLFTDQSFKEITAFNDITAGKYTFQVKAKGSSDIIVSVPDITLREGEVYTLVARGFKSPPQGNTNTFSVQLLRN
jgi:hypothetical protein